MRIVAAHTLTQFNDYQRCLRVILRQKNVIFWSCTHSHSLEQDFLDYRNFLCIIDVYRDQRHNIIYYLSEYYGIWILCGILSTAFYPALMLTIGLYFLYTSHLKYYYILPINQGCKTGHGPLARQKQRLGLSFCARLPVLPAPPKKKYPRVKDILRWGWPASLLEKIINKSKFF